MGAVSSDKYRRKPKCDRCRRKPKWVDQVKKFFPSMSNQLELFSV